MDLLSAGPVPPLRRDLEIVPVTHEGRELLLVSDMLGLRDDSVAVSPAVILIASLFDGRKTVADLRAELAGRNVILSETELSDVAGQLRKLGLLETEEAAEARRRSLEDFARSGVRRFDARRRGLPDQALEFGSFLGKFYSAPGGPGEPAAAGDAAPPVGLVSPHIDFFRGGPQYAWAYRELSGRKPPDVVVALGVAHMSPDSPWIMTRKSYETPLGPVEVDSELYDAVRRKLWYDPLEDEWVHAKEHSLEFQALWLRHVWRSETPKWLPVLCSSFERFCGDRPPSAVPTVEGALAEIGGLLADLSRKGRRVLVLAGVDFAHVGRRFGDELDVDDTQRKRIEAADRASIGRALALDADAFFLSGVGEGAWRKVCGLSALYTSLRWIKALGGDAGRELAYAQADDPAGGVVSFASAVFDRPA
jgi:MEMO1 family protein